MKMVVPQKIGSLILCCDIAHQTGIYSGFRDSSCIALGLSVAYDREFWAFIYSERLNQASSGN